MVLTVAIVDWNVFGGGVKGVSREGEYFRLTQITINFLPINVTRSSPS